MTYIATCEKEGIKKDISDTNMYLHEYIFKRLFLRTTLLFVVNFAVLSFLKLKGNFFNRDYLQFEIIIKMFNSVMIYSFAICALYVVIMSFGLRAKYMEKHYKVEKYNKALNFLQNKKEAENE